MQTLRRYLSDNVVDSTDTLVITTDDSTKDVIKWLLTQEDKETLIGMINAQSSINTL